MYWRWSNVLTLTLLALTLLTLMLLTLTTMKQLMMKQLMLTTMIQLMLATIKQLTLMLLMLTTMNQLTLTTTMKQLTLATRKQTTVNWKWREILWGNCCTTQRELFYAKWHLTLNNWRYRIQEAAETPAKGSLNFSVFWLISRINLVEYLFLYNSWVIKTDRWGILSWREFSILIWDSPKKNIYKGQRKFVHDPHLHLVHKSSL